MSDSCDPINCSLPGSSVYEISQARILEWVAISFSKGSFRLRDQTHVSCSGRWIPYQSHLGSPCIHSAVVCLVAQSCLTLCDPMDYSLPGSSVHGDSPRKNTGVGCNFLLQGIFPAQGSNPGLPHCSQILYRLSHQGSPRILEWVAYPFSREYFQPRN